ncbi:tRNA (adenosine(37)-N6)-dimethylallyltransferase MiaA [Lacticaseibacillus salsurivasis]|uniref:tRNA (adenosine(37)-N6)-dimethylallyltransferase MiaA n=1 Tax=Lacticaseibacillus salsurivasis TaxID=3081441 RepID=UPI0030C74F37
MTLSGNNSNQTQVLMIGGPTATGKSALAVALAKQFDGEVINGDAYQIYQGMDIGTAKVTVAEQGGVPHHLLDIVPPSASFSAAEFQRRAEAAIADIAGRKKLPIVVGGTGFYLNALRLGLPLGTQAASPSRARWQAALAAHDTAWLWQQLAAQDPAAAAKIPAGNSRRVIRALEVIEQTGQLFSAQPPSTPQYDTLVLALTTERATLYDRINARVEAMLKAGLVAEVQAVLAQAPPTAQALQAIGYKELLPYLAKEQSLAAATALIQQHSRHYAKRQLTYFRHQMPAHWLDLIADPKAPAQAAALVSAWRIQGGVHSNEMAR